MQFTNRPYAIFGIVVLLASSSKALIAQQYYYPTAPVYGYAPSVQYAPSVPYGSYQVYPSPEYANGFYEHGYSYPVLSESSDSSLNSDVAQEKQTESESEPVEFKSLGELLRSHIPTASSILGLEYGAKEPLRTLLWLRTLL